MQTTETNTNTANTLSPLAQAEAISQATGAGQPTTTNGKAAQKRVAKRTASKPSPVTTTAKRQPAKPTQAAREAAQRANADARSLARQAASKAVAEFYTGASKPFKAASDRFSDLNPANGKAPSVRQAGLLLALVTYGAGNIKPNGSFVRGGFVVPAKLVNASAKPGETIRAQPESGCLGNMLNRVAFHVSGPISGKAQSEAVFRIDAMRAVAEIQAAFGDKAANAARALLTGYGCKLEAKPSKRQRAA